MTRLNACQSCLWDDNRNIKLQWVQVEKMQSLLCWYFYDDVFARIMFIILISFFHNSFGTAAEIVTAHVNDCWHVWTHLQYLNWIEHLVCYQTSFDKLVEQWQEGTDIQVIRSLIFLFSICSCVVFLSCPIYVRMCFIFVTTLH